MSVNLKMTFVLAVVEQVIKLVTGQSLDQKKETKSCNNLKVRVIR